MVIDKQAVEKILLHQLNQYWLEIDEDIIKRAIPNAICSLESGFTGLPDRRFFNNGAVQFSPYMSVHWMIFLYRIAHEIYIQNDSLPLKEADQIYYLNKIMNSNDWYYPIELPVHFLCEHPLGSVLGRAHYGDYLFVYQGTTVGGNRNGGTICYPYLGNNVILFANSTVLGDTHIGNNVVISANTYIINEEIPDNSIVFGHSPNLVIKNKTEEEIKKYTKHIWGW